jgi:hypothetical protein
LSSLWAIGSCPPPRFPRVLIWSSGVAGTGAIVPRGPFRNLFSRMPVGRFGATFGRMNIARRLTSRQRFFAARLNVPQRTPPRSEAPLRREGTPRAPLQ